MVALIQVKLPSEFDAQEHNVTFELLFSVVELSLASR